MSNPILNDTFRITHPTGYLELRLGTFFPCTVVKAKKVFRLMRQHCSQEQQDALLAYLVQRAKAYEEQAVELDKELDALHSDPARYNQVFQEMKETCRKHTQLSRNIRDFVGR